MVVVKEPPLILFPGLTWGHCPKEMFGTKSCTVDDDSSTSDPDCDSDSDFTTDSDLGSSLTSCAMVSTDQRAWNFFVPVYISWTCTLKLITLSLRRLRRARSIPKAMDRKGVVGPHN